MKTKLNSRNSCSGRCNKYKRASTQRIRFIVGTIICYTFIVSCTKIDYNKIYPIGTKFNYAAGPLKDLIQQGVTPENPFVIDSISPNAYGSAIGYYVTSANGLYYTMSDCDIKVIN